MRLDHRAAFRTAWGCRDSLTKRALAASDVVALTLALIVAVVVAGERSPFEPMLLFLPTLPVWILIFKLYGLYDRDLKRISHSGLDDLPWLFHALVVGALLMWLYFKAVPAQQLTFLEIALFGTLAIVLVSGLRTAARKLVLRFLGPEHVVVVAAGPAANAVIDRMRAHPEYGLGPVGLIGTVDNGDHPGNGDRLLSIPALGQSSELARVIEGVRADRVVISRSEFDENEVIAMIEICRSRSIKVSLLPEFVDALGPSVVIDEVGGLTVLGINPAALSRSSRAVKRYFDCFVAGIMLAVTAPAFAAIALAIRLDSPGPALFRQQRVGKGGRRFELLKFRTMVRDAEQQRASLLSQSRDPNWLELEDDPRVTPVGRFLRRTSLDELPQLWNVLRGDMSLVGPRPLPVVEDGNVHGRMRGRLDLTPGITGLWQVLGRNRIPFEEMVKLDYVYVTNWSLWMDIRLLVRTAPVVLLRRGAN